MAIGSGTTVRVNVSAAGIQANGGTARSTLSQDGRFVAFASDATNLVASDTNSAQDLFLVELATGAVQIASVSSGGAQGNNTTLVANAVGMFSSLSSDGRYIAFESTSTNLVVGDTNGQKDVFLRDTSTGTTTLVSVTTGGTQANPDLSLNEVIARRASIERPS